MRVEFSPEIFASDGMLSPSVTLPPIVKIMACAVDGRHDWSADPPTLEVAARYFESHAPTMGPTYLELGRKGLVDAAWQSSFNTALVYVTLADLADVAEDICRSAVLVVEDLYSDGCFIRALAEVFRADHVLKALSAGWLEIRHGGGEQLLPVAEAARCTFRRAVCVVALLDSDRLLPDQRTKAHDKAKHLRTSGILVHVLELREAENYVPNRILAATISRPKDAQRKLMHMKRLSLAQRGHYDMKSGFRQRDGVVTVRNEQRELFDDLGEETVRALGDGFGRNLLPRLEKECGNLTEDDFAKLGSGVVAELRELLSTISKVI